MITITGQEDVGASVYYSKVFFTGQPEVIYAGIASCRVGSCKYKTKI